MRSTSLRGKLLTASVAPAGAAVLIVTLVIAGYLNAELRRDENTSLVAVATIIGENASAGLAFQDPEAVTDILAALRSLDAIAAAAVYDADGEIFAGYTRDPGERLPAHPPDRSGSVFDSDGLTLVAQIMVPGGAEAIGTTVLRSDLSDVDALLRRIWIAALLVGVAALAVAILLAWPLCQNILLPIARLASTATTVSQDQDYSARIESPGSDELGSLGQTFNVMLDQIESHDNALRERESYFRSLIEHSSDVITVLDADLVISYQSPAVRSVLGVEGETYLGRTVCDFAHPDDCERLEASLSRDAHTAEAMSLTFRAPHRDGSWRILEASVNASVRGTAKVHWVINARDVTGREALAAQLMHAQKMDAVGQLAAGVAHDFNNLLTPVIGFSELLLQRPDVSPAAHPIIENIVTAGERGALLVSQLLSFSRPASDEQTTFDLRSTEEGIEQLLKGAVGDEIELRVHRCREAATVRGDPGQMEQVLMNLVVNARDAIGGSGVIDVRIEVECLDEPVVDGRLSLDSGRHVRLQIADTGEGMDESTLQRIFEPFYTTKSVGKGTGLGLSTIFGIVQSMGGQIDVKSTVGVGSTFTVMLPHGGLIPDPDGMSTPSMRPAKGETVLLVDDDGGVRDVLSSILEDAGYQVHAADGWASAMTFAQSLASLDLVLTDLVMRGPTGRDVARDVTAIHPRARVVIMTGYAHPAVADGDASLNVDLLLRKPVSMNQLAEALHVLLDVDQPIV